MAAEFQGQFQEAMREAEMADLKKSFDEVKDAATRLHQLQSVMTSLQKDVSDALRSATSTSRRTRTRGRPRSTSRRADDAGSARAGDAASRPRRMPRRRAAGDRARSAAPRRRTSRRPRRACARTPKRHERTKDIEASKAPLMDHLIELRSRLIKALLGFGVAFIFCFFFAKQIYNVLVWPFVWVAGPENSKFIYTALLEYFLTQLKLALFGAGFISFPIVATQIYKFVAPGLYKHERGAFLPYLIATPFFFVLGAMLVYFVVHADAGAVLARHAADRAATRPRRSSCCPRSANICR